MMRRESTIYSVAWFADQLRAGKLDLDPPYQRLDMVWSRDYQQYFIDTILRDYPSPAIFLHIETAPDGHTVYHVVDGKQRLSAVFKFVEGGFTIPDKYAEAEYANREFNDLPSDVKRRFWEYSFPVQQVRNASDEELRIAFDRLNRNVARLSKQELRHARFPGEFLNLMEQLTDEPLWGDIGISTRTTAKRMRDVEFVSEVFLLTMHGVLDGTQGRVLDDYYSKYDSVPDKDTHMRQYRTCMRMVEDLGIERIKASRFNNLSDFYSLWAALLRFSDQPKSVDYGATMQALEEFDAAYKAFYQNPEVDKPDPDLVEYYDNVRQGVNKAANRKNRADVIAKSIKLKC